MMNPDTVGVGQPTSDSSFISLIERLRSPNNEAAAELVRRYQPEILRFIRFRLSGSVLRRVLDSLDLCQSVLLRLFDQLSRGRLELRHPQQLLRLLQAMCRNEILDQARRYQAVRRAGTFAPGNPESLDREPAAANSPSEIISAREIWDAVQARLSEDERMLLTQRLVEGREWQELAVDRGERSEALRKRLGRAIDRAARELGLLDDTHATDG